MIYTCSEPRPDCTGVPQIIQRNLSAIGLDVEIQAFPFPVLFEKLATPGEPFDIGLAGWHARGPINDLFDDRTSQPKSELLPLQLAEVQPAARRAAAGLPGPRATAPTASSTSSSRGTRRRRSPYARTRGPFVSARTGCVVMNPDLDLTAVCLK